MNQAGFIRGTPKPVPESIRPHSLEADWQKLVIRERKGLINLTLDAKSKPMSISGEFWGNGLRIKVTDTSIFLGQGDKSDSSIADLSLVGFALQLTKDRLAMNPHGGGVIVSWPNRRERLWKSAEAWRQIQGERTAVNRS